MSGDGSSMLSKSMNSGFASVFGPGEDVVKSLAYRCSDAQIISEIDHYKVSQSRTGVVIPKCLETSRF